MQLQSYLKTITGLSEKSWLLLGPALTLAEFKKGDFLLNAGDTCRAIFFISKGYCRSFYDKDGKDINTMFYFEKDFAVNIKSLSANMASAYAIQACETLSAVRFDKTRLLEAYGLSHEIETLGRKLLELSAAKQEEHAALFKLLNAQERYEYLQKNQPEFLQRVSLTQLSSYIGVSRETLSRIRGKK